MSAEPFKQNYSDRPPRPVNDFVAEALAKQKKLRPVPSPPKEMPVTPTLPRMPKPHKRRRGA